MTNSAITWHIPLIEEDDGGDVKWKEEDDSTTDRRRLVHEGTADPHALHVYALTFNSEPAAMQNNQEWLDAVSGDPEEIGDDEELKWRRKVRKVDSAGDEALYCRLQAQGYQHVVCQVRLQSWALDSSVQGAVESMLKTACVA